MLIARVQPEHPLITAQATHEFLFDFMDSLENHRRQFFDHLIALKMVIVAAEDSAFKRDERRSESPSVAVNL